MRLRDVQTLQLTQGDHIDHQDPMLEWHELEVCELHEWPNHPVALQGVEVCAVQLILGAASFHDCHARQEDKQVGTSEHCLVRGDTSNDLEVWLARNHHLLLEEAEPLGGCWTEDCTSVESHATCTCEVLVLNALLLDQLLSHCVAGCEEDGSGDGLGEERAGGQLGLVPVPMVVSFNTCQIEVLIAHTISERPP